MFEIIYKNYFIYPPIHVPLHLPCDLVPRNTVLHHPQSYS